MSSRGVPDDASERLDRFHQEAASVARRTAQLLLHRHPDVAQIARLDARAAQLRQEIRAIREARRGDEILWSGLRSPGPALPHRPAIPATARRPFAGRSADAPHFRGEGDHP